MKVIASLALCLTVLSACTTWETSYDAPVPAEVTRGWALGSVAVTVPTTLSVSEANSFLPEADIVWREDKLTGGQTRYQQVDAIVTDGITRGASGLTGSRPVRIAATVETFHALSEKARYGLSQSGVHNITYVMQVFDMRTDAPLTEPTVIFADLPALVGAEALEAEAQGRTQKVNITNHIAQVTAGYLSLGPDVRGGFQRVGR